MSFGAAFSRALLGTAQRAGAAVDQRRREEEERQRTQALMEFQRQQFEAQQAALRQAQQRQTALDQREFAEGGYAAVNPLQNASGRAMDAVPLPSMQRLAGLSETLGTAPRGFDVAFTYGGQEFAKTGPSLREQEQQAARTERLTAQSQDRAMRERERADDAARRAAELAAQQEFTRERDAFNAALQRQLVGMRQSFGAGAGQPTLRAAPQGVVTEVQGNMRQIGVINEALAALDENKQAVGLKTRLTPDYLLDRLDIPGFRDGAAARAAIADVGSLEIRDRSGAAVTASEFPRLRPFIPSADDPADVVRQKLRRMRDIIAEETRARASYYNEEGGYRPIIRDEDLVFDRPTDQPQARGIPAARPNPAAFDRRRP